MNRNFDQLTGKWQLIGKLGQEAEQYVTGDPSVALFKLRLFAEKMTDEILRLEGISPLEMDSQVDKLGKLEEKQRLPEEILKMFHSIRKAGNRAVHAGEGTVSEASMLLGQASRLGS
jgi:type I restriction enzyme R subunit